MATSPNLHPPSVAASKTRPRSPLRTLAIKCPSDTSPIICLSRRARHVAGPAQFRGPLPSRPQAIRRLFTLLIFFLSSTLVLAQKIPPAQPVNLNTVTIAQLETLPGTNTAKSIVDFRNRSGPFQRVEDLLAIKGISKSKFEKLRPYVTKRPTAPNRRPESPHQNLSSLNFQKAV